MNWLHGTVKRLDDAAIAAAMERQRQLTKPAGSLGQLEDAAIQLAGMQASRRPAIGKLQITVFAADHGVVEAGVSLFPQEVTAQMVANFAAGGAAISVLAKSLGARLEVVDVGTITEPAASPLLISHRAAAGTANFVQQDAMSPAQLAIALEAGRQAAERALEHQASLFIGGDMGIGNTTAATAIASVLLQVAPALLAGPGTGLDAAGVSRKARVITQALARYQGLETAPLEALRCVGGFEIAALTGAYIRCAQLGLPVLIDGFITTAAALVAARHNPAVRDWMLFSHQSAEQGHQQMLCAMGARPLLQLGMRLGEGSGAAATVPLLRLACELHNGMATFADAGVAEA